jgi:hypothetical protein
LTDYNLENIFLGEGDNPVKADRVSEKGTMKIVTDNANFVANDDARSLLPLLS